MNKNDLSVIRELRARLHACPELSGHEAVTMGVIRDFLMGRTSFEVKDMGGWLLAERITDEASPVIAFRADMDAIPGRDGPRHGCGHDGHSAILCGLALALEAGPVGKNIRLIFQPAEETGEGAKMICRSQAGLQNADRIYGLHNIPGHEKGAILTREGCFACASSGMILRVKGRPAHAAYPGDGANPAEALSRLVLAIPGMIEDILAGDDRLLMHTVVGLNIGGEDFGISPGDGRLCLTLRGHRREDIDALATRIFDFAQETCAEPAMECAFEMRDVFPDTTCTPRIVREARKAWQAAGMSVKGLDAPMRWSEDFGWYLRTVPGMFFGVGAGENAPGLHTRDYEFDDALIEPAVDALYVLAAL